MSALVNAAASGSCLAFVIDRPESPHSTFVGTGFLRLHTAACMTFPRGVSVSLFGVPFLAAQAH